MTKNTEIVREALDLNTAISEVKEAFCFASPRTIETETACKHIASLAQQLAVEITKVLPEGKESTVAVNNVLSAVLWVRHGLCRRQIEMIVVKAPKA